MPTETVITQERRRERLREIINEENPQELYSQDAQTAADDGYVPRYCVVSSEGSAQSTYRDNPDIDVADDREALAGLIAGSFAEGWGVWQVTDLDTGEEVGYTLRVDFDE